MSLFSFKGFIQIYQLKTENDEEETWRDLVFAWFGLRTSELAKCLS